MDRQEKIKKLVDYAKEHNALETKKYILDVFQENENVIQREDINQAYYDSHIINVYPKNMQGIYISIQEGDWDRLGSNVSHVGIDIDIINPFQNDATMTLFQESERHMMGNFNLNHSEVSKNDIINYFESDDSSAIVYKTLSHGMKEDLDIMKAVTSKIKEQAKFKTSDEKEYSDISPNGGLDVYVHDWRDHYLSMLDEFRDGQNDSLVTFAEKEFAIEEGNQKYIQDEILRNEKIIYFVEHKDEYFAKQAADLEIMDIGKKLSRLHESLEDSKKTLPRFEIEEVELQNQLDKLKKQKGFFNKIINKKKIERLEMEIEGYEPLIAHEKDKINEIEKEIQDLICKQDNLSKKYDLKYSFKYLLKDTFREFYDYYENFDEALSRMENNYDNAKKGLDYFKYLESGDFEKNNEVKHLKAVDIQWDVDEKEDLESLPSEISIPDGMAEDDISDYLSDVTGFCHKGFELVEKKEIEDESGEENFRC